MGGCPAQREHKEFTICEKYHSHNLDTSKISELEHARRIASVTAPPTPEQPRFIQAQIFIVQHGELRQVCEAFVGGEKYAASVRIGPADQAWLTPETELPEYLLPHNEECYMLQVFFSEPNHIPEAQTATILLPRRGPSTDCHFVFSVRKETPVFEGRIIIVHKNRILQTALLKGDVVGDVTQVANAQAVRLETEVVVRPVMVDLSGRQRFDAAFAVNQAPDGQQRLLALADEHSVVRGLKDIQDRIDAISRCMSTVANDAPSYANGLDSKEAMNVLRFLADNGR